MLNHMAHVMASRRIAVSRSFALLFFILAICVQGRGGAQGVLIGLLGLLLIAAAVVGRLWCSLYISGYKNENLIQVGPYSLCRNPLYFFSMLGFTGLGCATGSASIGALLLLAFLCAYPVVIRSEERFLAERFGPTFSDYCTRIPRLWPRFNQFNEPDNYTVNPKLFRRTMLDVIWFVFFFALLQVIALMHQLGWLPTWWVLP